MNLRGHYKSRTVDFTNVTFNDYLSDINDIIKVIEVPPILVGFSMGGILCQKIAEYTDLAGLVLIDSSISKQVYDLVPENANSDFAQMVIPAPIRDGSSLDESLDDIDFQKKYLSLESALAFREFAFTNDESQGISIDSNLIHCPCLVIKAISSDVDNERGLAEAKHLNARYKGFYRLTHTGLLVGQRYLEVFDNIIAWLNEFFPQQN